MGFRINTNIAAMNAHGNSVMNNRNLDDSLSKLSSGLRINKAADDASGMVIANSLRNQANSLGQAVSNGNDGIGLIQTADGALNEYSKILDTIKTKAVQAASDGQNTTSRTAIQKDINRLMEELNMIAKTTSFNGQNLLSGSFSNKQIQMGASSNQTVGLSVASAETNKLGHTSRAQLNLVSETGGVQLTVKSALTGENVTMKNVDIQYNNSRENGLGALADEINSKSGITGIRAQAVVEVTSTNSIQAGAADFSINGIAIGALGSIKAGDSDGALLAAINGKTTQTGVAATMTDDGKMKLTSTDGRAIKVTGNVSAVFGGTANSLTTVGTIELVQKGAAEFQVNGIGAGATGANLVSTGTTTMVVDSTLAAGSSLLVGASLKAGTTIGGDVTTTGSASTVLDTTLKAGSQLLTASVIKEGTTVGGTVTISGAAATTMTSDTYLTAGSTLGSGTIMDSGTIIQQDFTDNAITHHKGDVLTTDLTLSNALTLTAAMTIKYDAVAPGSKLGAATTLNTGSVVGATVTTTGTSTISTDMVLKAGSTITSGSTLKAGTLLGVDTTNNGTVTTSISTTLKAGSTLSSGSTMSKGSTVGGTFTIGTITTLTSDMTLKAGSSLGSGTTLAIGTVMAQDTTAAQTGTAMKAGDVLTTAVATLTAISLAKDMTLLSANQAGKLGINTIINMNTDNSGSVGIGATSVTNLSGVNVLTLKDAMKTIDTMDAAISDLDTIRADLGSVQNQLVATINNISVTQVNVKAAESQLRDVDFAAESANFSKFNILAQSGSYAMSQSNAVQQNVLRLLQ